MKGIYLRHVHEALDRHIPEALPGYVLWPLKLSKEERKTATLFRGSRLYGRTVPEGVLFLHLIPHQRQERIQAEVGWSVGGRFPVALSSHGPVTKPLNEWAQTEWLIDFGELYHRKYGLAHLGWDVWQCSVGIDDPDFLKIFVQEDLAPVSEEQARQRAEAAVVACLRDLQDVAMPYLDEWIAFRAARDMTR